MLMSGFIKLGNKYWVFNNQDTRRQQIKTQEINIQIFFKVLLCNRVKTQKREAIQMFATH